MPHTPPFRPSRVLALAAAALVVALPLAPAARALAQPDSQAVAAQGAQAKFKDVAGNWAAGDIATLLRAGIFSVPADGLFRPGDPVTRLDFTLWIARALELSPGSGPAPFADTADLPMAEQTELAAAVSAGLITGLGPHTFAPQAPITRLQLATILGRALQPKGEFGETRFFTIFKDGGSIPAWGLPASILIKDNLIYGEPCLPEPCFAPSQDTTRAQAAALIVRFLQYLTTRYHRPPLPPPNAPGGLVLGMWYSNTTEGYSNLVRYGGDLNELIYGGYDIVSGGALVGYDSPRTLNWAASHTRVPLWVMVQASSLSFLGNAEQTASLLNTITAIVQRAGYAGVDFDVEGIPGSERQAYTDFIAAAASRLHAEGAKISVAVPSETAYDLGQWWDEAYDYPALGRSVDQLIMMAYDYHYAGGTPGPISPIGWDREVIDYAKSVMPPSKVFLGMPLYGYVWNTSNDQATAYWILGMTNTAAEYGASISFDPSAQEATYSYFSGGHQYVGWFVNAEGAAARIQLAHASGIGGVIGWRLDYGAPNWWLRWASALAKWH